MRHRRSFSVVCAVVVCLSAALRAQATSPSSSIQIVYVLSGSTVQTYDVDPQTGFPTQEGQGVVLPGITNPALLPSKNDHFLYMTGFDSHIREHLWVLATDSTGVPQLPAIQEISLSNTGGFEINPNGTLAYAVETTSNSKGQMVAAIHKFAVNPTTGRVTKYLKAVAIDPPNGPCSSGVEFSGLGLIGFNSSGTQMYTQWGCAYHNNISGFYYSRTVNQKTGAVGPNVQLFSWDDGSLGTDLVHIAHSALIYFNVPNPYNVGLASVKVYPPTGGTTPLFTCTAAMLEACGYGTYDWVDRSGNYIFIQISPTTAQITKLERQQKRIVDTGYYVSGIVWAFSPDDALVYVEDGQLSNPYIFYVYVFNPATGGVMYTGGQISSPSAVEAVVTALRQ